MAKQSVLITGGNTGLGLEIAKALWRSSGSYEIIIGSRSVERGESALGELHKEVKGGESEAWVVQLDVEDEGSVAQAAETVKAKLGHVDVVVNNAGTQLDQRAADNSLSQAETWNRTLAVNVTGSHLVAWHFAPLLVASTSSTGARLIFVTSSVGSLAEHVQPPYPGLPMDQSPPSGWPKPATPLAVPAYRASKAAVNMLMREWTRLLGNDDNVRVVGVTPGWLATDLGGLKEMLRQFGAMDPRVGGEFCAAVVRGEWDSHQGEMIGSDGVHAW